MEPKFDNSRVYRRLVIHPYRTLFLAPIVSEPKTGQPRFFDAELRGQCRARSRLFGIYGPFLLLKEEGRADLFDPPGRAPLIELSFFANKGGRGAFKNPDMRIVGLLPDNRSYYSGQSAKFNVKNEVGRFSLDASDSEGDVARRLDRDVNQPRLLRWCEER